MQDTNGPKRTVRPHVVVPPNHLSRAAKSTKLKNLNMRSVKPNFANRSLPMQTIQVVTEVTDTRATDMRMQLVGTQPVRCTGACMRRTISALIITVVMLPSLCYGRGGAVKGAAATTNPKDYEFIDTKDGVRVRGSRGIFLFPKDGSSGWGPGATVNCTVESKRCVVIQFHDGGAAWTATTYKVTRWDKGRIEAEFGVVDTPRA